MQEETVQDAHRGRLPGQLALIRMVGGAFARSQKVGGEEEPLWDG